LRIIGIATLIAASAIGFSAIAADAPQGGQQSKASTAKPDDLDRIVCKAPVDGDTGTRLPAKKTCHSKREWNEISDNARRLMDDRVTHQNNPTSR
jgi:hypothetical protein